MGEAADKTFKPRVKDFQKWRIAIREGRTRQEEERGRIRTADFFPHEGPTCCGHKKEGWINRGRNHKREQIPE